MIKKIEHPYFIMFIAIFIGTVGVFSSDLYLPSLPAISIFFHATKTDVQWTITVFVFGLGFSQLFYGPLSDRIGRRKTCLLGISICFFGSIICAFSASIRMLLFGRILQAFGAGAGAALSRAVLRDIFSGKKLIQVVSFNSIIFSLAPAAAPIIGGYIEHYLNWRFSFIFIIFYVLIALILVWLFMPETNQNLNPKATQLTVILKNYKTLLTSKIFIGYVMIGSTLLAGFIAYLTTSPFLFQSVLGLSPIQYGWLAIYIMIAAMISRILNILLLNYFSMHTNMLIGLIVMTSSGIIMLLFGLKGVVNLYVIFLPILLYVLAGGLVSTNAAAGAFMPFATIAGATGALYGFIQFLICSTTSAISAGLHSQNQIPLALIFIVLGLFACIGFSFFILTQHFNPEAEQ